MVRALLIGAIFGRPLCRSPGGAGWIRGPRPCSWSSHSSLSSPALALRPQLLGMACFVLVAWLLTIRRDHPRALWLVPVVVAVWANLHGSFFLGPALVGLAWLEDLHDRAAGEPVPLRTLLVAFVSLAAACLTPFGPCVWVYAVGLSVNPEVTARISEWQPTSLRDVPGLLFFGSALAVVVLIARRGRMTSWPALAGLAVFFVIGVYAQRGLAWWALGAVPIVASELLSAAREQTRPDPPLIRRLNLVVAGLLVVVAIAVLPGVAPDDPGTGAPAGLLSYAPPGITTAVRDLQRPGDHVFQPQVWGSWFEHALPTIPVAIDSRTEFFPPEVWRAYEGVLDGVDGWQDQLDTWGVTLVVTTADAAADAFGTRLTTAGWVEVYRDRDGRIYVRTERSVAVRPSGVLPRRATFGAVT